jgi:hypothetical protein
VELDALPPVAVLAAPPTLLLPQLSPSQFESFPQPESITNKLLTQMSSVFLDSNDRIILRPPITPLRFLIPLWFAEVTQLDVLALPERPYYVPLLALHKRVLGEYSP